MINLVDQKMPLFFAADLGQRLDLRQRQQRAGRVGRRSDEQAGGPGVPVLAHEFRCRLEIGVRPDRDVLRSTFVNPQNMAVAGIAGVGQQPFAARVGEAGESEVERAGGAVGDGDAAGGDRDAIALAIKIGYRFAQFRQAERLRVQRFAAFYRVDRSIRDWRRGREVGFADFHVDDVAPFGFQLAGTGQQFDDMKGFDLGESLGGTVHGFSKEKRPPGLVTSVAVRS